MDSLWIFCSVLVVGMLTLSSSVGLCCYFELGWGGLLSCGWFLAICCFVCFGFGGNMLWYIISWQFVIANRFLFLDSMIVSLLMLFSMLFQHFIVYFLYAVWCCFPYKRTDLFVNVNRLWIWSVTIYAVVQLRCFELITIWRCMWLRISEFEVGVYVNYPRLCCFVIISEI